MGKKKGRRTSQLPGPWLVYVDASGGHWLERTDGSMSVVRIIDGQGRAEELARKLNAFEAIAAIIKGAQS